MDFFGERLDKLTEVLPDLAITSDVIVGFPGETEEEFMETYDFIAKYKFAELHVFPFSKRTGTPAARMEDQVDEDVKNERVHRLLTLNNQLEKEYAARFEDQLLEVIPEDVTPDGLLVGHTANYLKVTFDGSPELIGKLVRVKISQAGYPQTEAEFVRVLEEIEYV